MIPEAEEGGNPFPAADTLKGGASSADALSRRPFSAFDQPNPDDRMLVDTHAHLYVDDFSGDREQVMARALGNGVRRIILPNIDSASAGSLLAMAEAYPGVCLPLMGLHPTSVREDYKRELDAVNGWFDRALFHGVGETGIDLYWDRTFLVQQRDAFREQLRIARRLALPVVIHVRDSFSEVFEILEAEQDGSLTGIFHCFSGSAAEAEKVTGAGFHLGIGGVVTFSNSSLPRVLESVDLQHLVLETDAPWLSPVPFRGKRNESGYLPLVAQKVAALYGCPLEEVARITTANAVRLFKSAS